jgi:hypothetical protein
MLKRITSRLGRDPLSFTSRWRREEVPGLECRFTSFRDLLDMKATDV